MFALDLPGIGMWQEIDNAILTRNELNNYVLIIGPPGSGKLKSLKNKIKYKLIETGVETGNTFIADLIHIPVTEKKENGDMDRAICGFDSLFKQETEKKEEDKWEEIKAEVKKDKYKLIIVDHFGYNMNHTKTNIEKLAFLENLMITDQNNPGQNKKVIILSTVHPYVFLDSLTAQQKEESNGTDYNLQRWIEVLGHYRIIITPLEQTDIREKEQKLNNLINTFVDLSKEKNASGTHPDEKVILGNLNQVLDKIKVFTRDNVIVELATEQHHYKLLYNQAETALKDMETLQINDHVNEQNNIPASKYDILPEAARNILKEIMIFAADKSNESGQKILRETQYTHFLNKLQRPISEIAGKPLNKPVNSDSLALKIQLNSQHFYMYIWNSLTKEEKFILYDLAEDGLVNTHDIFNLTMLISKGLIQRDNDGTLRVFNKSFRNFIITSIGYTESNKIKKEIKENGNWNKWRTPLVIIIIGIFSLLITSQQEIYSKVIGYLTVLVTAVIPLLQRLFAMFEKSNTKS